MTQGFSINKYVADPIAMWKADTHAGYGSTDTKIPYFTNVRVNTDPDSNMTVTNNSTNGCKVTINKAGIYAISFSFRPTTSERVGITLNDTSLTSTLDNVAQSQVLAKDYASNDESCNCSWTGKLEVGDVVRPHDNAIGSTSTHSFFTITKVANVLSESPTQLREVKAWVNFNGTGTLAVRSSYNVSSVTDNGVGLYTVNFTNALDDGNYCAIATYGGQETTVNNVEIPKRSSTPTSSSVAMIFDNGNSDSLYINVAVFR